MSSFKRCIKFSLNIKDKNIIFLHFFNEFINGKAQKVYVAELINTVYQISESYFAKLSVNKYIKL